MQYIIPIRTIMIKDFFAAWTSFSKSSISKNRRKISNPAKNKPILSDFDPKAPSNTWKIHKQIVILIIIGTSIGAHGRINNII